MTSEYETQPITNSDQNNMNEEEPTEVENEVNEVNEAKNENNDDFHSVNLNENSDLIQNENNQNDNQNEDNQNMGKNVLTGSLFPLRSFILLFYIIGSFTTVSETFKLANRIDSILISYDVATLFKTQ